MEIKIITQTQIIYISFEFWNSKFSQAISILKYAYVSNVIKESDDDIP
jgi:hypothetical protein